MARLITDPRPALAAIVAGSVIALGLAVIVWHGSRTAFDTWVARQSLEHLGSLTAQRRVFWLLFTEPGISVGMPTLVVLGGVLGRQWRFVVLAVVAPPIALVITEWVGKPLVHRAIGSVAGELTRGCYPSGHETGAVSWLTIAVLVAVRAPLPSRVRVAAIVVASLWALGGAIGLTVNFYHYATDTIGAIGTAVAVVLGIAFAIDAVADRTVTIRRLDEEVYVREL